MWKLAVKYPEASRAIAFHADEIIPLAKRVGPEVLEIEARLPGLSSQIANQFGDDAIKTFSKMPQSEAIKLTGIGSHCSDNATKKLLLEAYKKSPSKDKFIEYFTPTRILASGATISMIIAAYKVSGGAEELLISTGEGIKKSDKVAEKVATCIVGSLTFPFALGGTLIAVILSIYLVLRLKLPEKIISLFKDENRNSENHEFDSENLEQ